MTVSNTTARTSAVGTNTAGQEISFSFPIASTGALATTSECHIIRETDTTQSLDLTQGGSFSAEDIEDALDYQCKLAINNADALNRSLRAPSTDDSDLDMELPNSVDRASQYLAFDSDGEPTVVASVAPDTADITAYAQTFLDDANDVEVRATLGLTIGTNVQAWDAQLDDIAALAVTDSNIIVGNGSNWVAESGATARASLGVAAASDTPLVSTTLVDRDTGNVMTDRDTGNIMVIR